MQITEFTEDMNIISALPDAPGLTAAELKAKFDKSGVDIKAYLNSTLIPEVEEAVEDLEEQIEDIPTVADNFTTDSPTVALSASRGKFLYDLATEQAGAITSHSTTIASLVTSVGNKQNKITYGTSNPTGGSDGDIYIKY